MSDLLMYILEMVYPDLLFMIYLGFV